MSWWLARVAISSNLSDNLSAKKLAVNHWTCIKPLPSNMMSLSKSSKRWRWESAMTSSIHHCGGSNSREFELLLTTCEKKNTEISSFPRNPRSVTHENGNQNSHWTMVVLYPTHCKPQKSPQKCGCWPQGIGPSAAAQLDHRLFTGSFSCDETVKPAVQWNQPVTWTHLVSLRLNYIDDWTEPNSKLSVWLRPPSLCPDIM